MLLEIAILAFEGVHDEAVVGEEVHASPVVDDPWLRYLHEFEELAASEFHPVGAGYVQCGGRRGRCCASCSHRSIISSFFTFLAVVAIYKACRGLSGSGIENAISGASGFYGRGIDVDAKDEAILAVVGRRAGLSSRALSGLLDIPISTVHRRIKRLERDRVITGYKALIDYAKTPWPIGVLLLIDLAEAVPGKGPIPKQAILTALHRFPEIEEILEVQAATFDLAVKARFRSLKQLSTFIEALRAVDGIEETSTAIVTDEHALAPPLLQP